MQRCGSLRRARAALLVVAAAACYPGETQPSVGGVQITGGVPPAPEDTTGDGTSLESGEGSLESDATSSAATDDGVASADASADGAASTGAAMADECASGRFWTDGDQGSKEMRPGWECIDCHTAEDQGPDYWVAGTLYSALHEPDDCYGAPGATVEIVDAGGVVYSLATNEAGNFWLKLSDAPGFQMPYTALVRVNGEESAMIAAQTDGDCSVCHTQFGLEDADGRIVGP